MGKRRKTNNTDNSTSKAQKPRVSIRDLDGCCKECFGSPARACDLLNNTIIREHNMPAIDPNNVAILDPNMVNFSNTKKPRKRYLDILLGEFRPGLPKIITNLLYVYDLEFQTEVHYGMVRRHEDYAVCVYNKHVEDRKDAEYQVALGQWEADVAKARKNKRKLPPKPNRREADNAHDRVPLCIPVTFYIGPGSWTAPITTYDTAYDINRQALVTNYTYNVIDPHTISDDIFSLFSTDVGLILKVLKYQSDHAMLKAFSKDLVFSNLAGAVARFINTATGSELEKVINMKGDVIDMCEGLRIWAANERSDGKKEGKQETNAIYRELLAGTPKKEICKKLGVTMTDVKNANAVFMQIRSSNSVQVSP